MSDTGGKLPHRFQLLRLRELCPQLIPFGDVIAHPFIAQHYSIFTNGAYVHADPDSLSIFAKDLALEVPHASNFVHDHHELDAALGIGE